MTDTSPETLLQSALEKIVYFEARSTQLSNDLESSRVEAERLRTELAAAAQREIELRRTLAELEVRLGRAHAEREETARVCEALKAERVELIGKVLDASRISSAAQAGDADGYDLAQFIATLRQEVKAKDGAAPQLSARAPAASRADDVVQVAQELKAQGRLGVSAKDLGVLEAAQPFDGKTEETLFGFSVRELSAPDGGSRIRAAERLRALAHPAAAPALVTALHAEREPKVQVALLAALGQLGNAEAAASVAPLASSQDADVRLAALKALLQLDAARAAPHLSAAMKDPDRAVRRRASLLALGVAGSQALELGAQAIHDADADVRALGSLVLGASGSLDARPLLTDAMRDVDLRVRRSAAKALSRLVGQDVTSVATLDDAQRRREVRRLSLLPTNPVRMQHTPPAPQPARVAAPTPAPARAATVEAPAPLPPITEAQREALLTELRAAIRGRPLEDLASSTGLGADTAQRALTELLATAAVVRRGHKYFVA